MARRMNRRPSFIVITVVVVLLGVCGFAAKFLRPLIPAPEANRLSRESGDFLRQAERQPIDWRVFSPDSFALARRLDRPIALCLGVPWSKDGRQFDHQVFSQIDVQNLLDRNFVCIRVDGADRPDLLSLFLPVRRLKSAFDPGFQFWILTPKGMPLDYVSPQNLDHAAVFRQLLTDSNRYADRRDDRTALAQDAAADLQSIESTPGTLDLDGFKRRLVASIQPGGGFGPSDFVAIRPIAIDFLLDVGERKAARAALDPLLRSPLVDPVDGGFYRRSHGDPFHPEFDKVAVQEAEIVELLARLYAEDGGPLIKKIAEEGFDHLMESAASDHLIAGCVAGDETAFDRSVRSSFPDRRLQELFPDEAKRAKVSQAFGLSDPRNPVKAPFIADEAAFLSGDAAALIHSLDRDEPAFAARGYADINGHSLARLIRAARALGDSKRLERALETFEEFSTLRANDLVGHGRYGSSSSESYLSDALGFADAALSAYSASGRVDFFESGLAVLKRARTLFVGNVPGEFFMASSDAASGPIGGRAPQIADDFGESSSAAMARLCLAYGRMMLQVVPGRTREQGLSLIQTANAVIDRLGPIASQGDERGAGIMREAIDSSQDVYAICVGPNAQSLADELIAKAPSRLVAPAFGHVREDLQRKGPGIYVLSGSSVEGPLDVQTAARRLSLRADAND